MIPTPQYLIAEYLQLHGAKTSAKLACRFTYELETMRSNLRSMARNGFIESDNKRPQAWSFKKLPLREKIVNKKRFDKAEYRGRVMFCDGFYKPDLAAFTALPVVRL